MNSTATPMVGHNGTSTNNTHQGGRNVPNYKERIHNANNMRKVPNFWQPGKYKTTVRLIDDGAHLLDDLAKFSHERASIEKKYAQMLSAWSKRWHEKISKGAEDSEGTLKPAWLSLLSEADDVAEMHLSLGTQMKETVYKDVLQWKKGVYSKQMGARQWKVTKKATAQFQHAQKPWRKGLKYCKKAKKMYYAACEAEISARQRFDNAGDLALEERQKLELKLEKATSTAESTRDTYKTAILFLEKDKQRYQTDMKDAYDFCEDVEQRRQDYFRDIFSRYTSILAQNAPEETKPLLQAIEAMSSDADLMRYRRTRGPEMPLCVPPYEEFGTKPTIQVVVNDSLPSHVTMSTVDLVPDGGESEDDGWDDDVWTPPPDLSAGRPVRALYDYVAEEEEEISMRAGDIITLIEEEDEQGWCKGVHADGSAGLFPACYVQDVPAEEGQGQRQQQQEQQHQEHNRAVEEANESTAPPSVATGVHSTTMYDNTSHTGDGVYDNTSVATTHDSARFESQDYHSSTSAHGNGSTVHDGAPLLGHHNGAHDGHYYADDAGESHVDEYGDGYGDDEGQYGTYDGSEGGVHAVHKQNSQRSLVSRMMAKGKGLSLSKLKRGSSRSSGYKALGDGDHSTTSSHTPSQLRSNDYSAEYGDDDYEAQDDDEEYQDEQGVYPYDDQDGEYNDNDGEYTAA